MVPNPMTRNLTAHTFPRSKQPSRLRAASPLNRGAAVRRSSGAGNLNVGDASDPGRDEETRRAVGMIRAGLEILLSRIDDGEPIPTADLLASRAERFRARLTDAEFVVLTQYAEGESVDEIAESRGIRRRTVDNQLSTAVRKLGFMDRREMTGYLNGAREMAALLRGRANTDA